MAAWFASRKAAAEHQSAGMFATGPSQPERLLPATSETWLHIGWQHWTWRPGNTRQLPRLLRRFVRDLGIRHTRGMLLVGIHIELVLVFVTFAFVTVVLQGILPALTPAGCLLQLPPPGFSFLCIAEVTMHALRTLKTACWFEGIGHARITLTSKVELQHVWRFCGTFCDRSGAWHA
mmetsp:Transcript_119482/g.283640  ORF Transcript_119482/g.283640 Transcript_119482/m.283640 type:complete len:177 (-) Transcript_119482:277-807(-)